MEGMGLPTIEGYEMGKHTGGEWGIATIDGGAADDEIVSQVNGFLVNIASVFGQGEYSEARPDGEEEPHYEVSKEEAAANARLIAAAPKLLESLKRLVDLYGVTGMVAYDEAKEVIAEATGE